MIELTRGSKAIIFDCDGTLADTMPAHFVAWNETLAPFGASVSEKDFIWCAGQSSVDIVKRLNELYGWNLDAEQCAKLKEDRFRETLQEVIEIEAVASVARKCAGVLPMAVVSGGTAENVHVTLERIGLRNLFPVVITADDPVEPKPSPKIFLEAARRLGVPAADCIVFEDADAGLAGATAAGMKCVDVRKYLPK